MKANGLIIGIMLLIAHATLAQQTRDDKYISVNGVGFKMVYVEGGTFTMGCTSEQNTLHRAIGGGCGENEKPTHSVTLSSYYIGEVEVTQELWKAVMGSNSNPFAYRGDNLPVNDIPYSLLLQFISKLNQLTNQFFRLPTEAEWEYAARGGKKSRGYMYSGSNSIEQVAWYKRNSEYVPQPVKRKAPNELGIYDMSGNVKELCGDWYGEYSYNSQVNPTGPSSGKYYVCRGGDYRDAEWSCRNSCRNSYDKDERSDLIGFRLVMVDEYCENESKRLQRTADNIAKEKRRIADSIAREEKRIADSIAREKRIADSLKREEKIRQINLEKVRDDEMLQSLCGEWKGEGEYADIKIIVAGNNIILCNEECRSIPKMQVFVKNNKVEAQAEHAFGWKFKSYYNGARCTFYVTFEWFRFDNIKQCFAVEARTECLDCGRALSKGETIYLEKTKPKKKKTKK